MHITTNNHWRNFLYGYELSESERAEFDYIDRDDIDTHSFIRYRGMIIDPHEFMRIDETMLLHPENDTMNQWQCYQSDSYFSGMVLRYSNDFKQYQIGTYIS